MNNDFTPMQLNHRELERLKRYKELLDFYHGRHWLRERTITDCRLSWLGERTGAGSRRLAAYG